MPFVQMENISIFLRACQAPPLNLQQHDTFLTVDLYEQKDPAQVLQCLGAFSRAANALNPGRFPAVIGPKTRAGAGVVSPQATGPATSSRDRGISVTSNTSSSAYGGSRPVLPHRTGDSAPGRHSPTKSPGSPGTVSSWSRKEHEGATSPAWNIAQYGYMGGASQGNLGIAFGARRQITSAAPKVPSLADKERMRKEKEAEEERQRQAAAAEEEERARLEEERRWEEETQRLREEERRKAAEEKRRWEEEERQWKLTEERRRKDEEEAEARLAEERRRARSRSGVRLRGQLLSQYQADERQKDEGNVTAQYSSRVKELERELELARQREAEYERERQGRDPKRPAASDADAKARARSRSRAAGEPSRQDSYVRGQPEILQTPRTQHRHDQIHEETPEPAVSSPPLPARSPRPLPEPTATPKVKSHNTGGSRPLPDPEKYTSPPAPQTRTDRYLATHPAPAPASPQQTYSRELGGTAEQDAEDRRRAQGQSRAKAGGWAAKSLLEREMEMERQRQREWEEAQRETAAAAAAGQGGDGAVDGVGGRWDVSQWSGFTGGDSQNKGQHGIGAGRRQIVGPRPLPGSK